MTFFVIYFCLLLKYDVDRAQITKGFEMETSKRPID